MAKKEAYGNQSISQLTGPDRVRLRPAVIFGSDGLGGCEHAIFEILSNSIDEAREGYGSLITLTYYRDCSIEVEDFGRGCPMDWNEREQRWNWELVFCELYAGGKYNNNAEGGDYGFALGLNGLGSCATQYASRWMDVTVRRDGQRYDLHFEKGYATGESGKELKRSPADRKKTGTRIHWLPDLDVFTDIAVPEEYFDDCLRRQAVANAGLRFQLRLQQPDGSFTEREYLYPNGITDYVKELAGEAPLTEPHFIQTERRGRDREDRDEYRVKITAAFCFTNKASVLEYYHNSSWLENGGAPDKAVRSAFQSVIDGWLKNNGKYLKNESSVRFQDIQDCLVLVTNCFSTQTSYENQTKKAINNRFIQLAMTEFFREQLEVYLIENKPEAIKIAEQVLINKRSRETAERARQGAKKKLSGNLDISNRVQKFVDCRSRDPERREIYIVEGDSALGACKLSRDAEFQGIMPVRGKILNCLKADYVRIFKSDVITDLLRVLGCGVEVKDKHVKDLNSFDIGSLRWSKVIICTDADVDGYQIRTLILTMLYRLVPTLIREGYVYIAESPLYEINAKGKTWFAYTEKEKTAILSKIGDKTKVSISRSKGLGENDPDMMWLTTMNPETRRLIRIAPEDAERMSEVFELLLGDNLEGRKVHIAQYGADYLDQADLS